MYKGTQTLRCAGGRKGVFTGATVCAGSRMDTDSDTDNPPRTISFGTGVWDLVRLTTAWRELSVWMDFCRSCGTSIKVIRASPSLQLQIVLDIHIHNMSRPMHLMCCGSKPSCAPTKVLHVHACTCMYMNSGASPYLGSSWASVILRLYNFPGSNQFLQPACSGK